MPGNTFNVTTTIKFERTKDLPYEYLFLDISK